MVGAVHLVSDDLSRGETLERGKRGKEDERRETGLLTLSSFLISLDFRLKSGESEGRLSANLELAVQTQQRRNEDSGEV